MGLEQVEGEEYWGLAQQTNFMNLMMQCADALLSCCIYPCQNFQIVIPYPGHFLRRIAML
eukprot:9256189-Ditylum_brightwellii.AAC.1